jgi:hypothetical protein
MVVVINVGDYDNDGYDDNDGFVNDSKESRWYNRSSK